MDPWRYLPSDFRTRWGGGPRRLRWQADLGAGASAGDIASYLQDIHVLLECGQRWGRQFAVTGAMRSFHIELSQSLGDIDLSDEDRNFYLSVIDQIEKQRLIAEEEADQRPTAADLDTYAAAIDTLISSSAKVLLGEPMAVQSLHYENPIRINLLGSGLGFRGVEALVGSVSRWKQRRDERAERDEAESSARTRFVEAQATYMEEMAQQAQAARRIRMTQADLAEMYALGVKAGNYPIVPPQDLADLVTPSDLAAIARLQVSDFATEIR